MGQQLPYLQNGQNAYALQLPAAPTNMPNPGVIPGMGQPQSAQMPAIPGVDPQMMQQAQQSLANPNGGDVNGVGAMSNLFPGPKELGMGAAAGVGTAFGFGLLDQHKVFDTGAEWLDKIPGAKTLGAKSEKWLQDRMANSKPRNQQRLREFFLTDAVVPKGSSEQKINSTIKSTVDQMEREHLKPIVERFSNGFTHKKTEAETKEMKAAYEKLVKDLGGKHPNFLDEKSWKDMTIRTIEANPQKSIPEELAAHHYLTKQFEHLDAKKGKNKAEQALHKLLRQTKESAGSISELYSPLYESQAKLTAELSAKGVGPVGRTFRSFTNYLHRIFRGDTMGMGAKGFLAKGMGMLGPALMGAFVFGFSFQSAKNAKDGENIQAFFHNLLGQQIFNFIGWEFGRKLLNAVGFRNILGRFAKKTPLALLRHIPMIGGLIGGATLGGIATELAAMIVFGGIMQKVGEKISHAIFGKPSQASIDGKGNTPSQNGQVPGQGQNPQQPGQQGQNSPLSGAFNPTLMNQAMNQAYNPRMSQAGMPSGMGAMNPQMPYAAYPGMAQSVRPMAQQSPMMSQGMTPPTGPTGGYPASNIVAPNNPGSMAASNAAPYAAQQRMAQPAPQPPLPKFSLTPAQISHSQVASDYNTAYSKLKADKTLDKRPGELLDKM